MTGVGALDPQPDAGRDIATDAGIITVDAPIDAWHAPDAPLLDDGCFPDVPLVHLSGGRESVTVSGLLPHGDGWLVLYSASSHGGTEGQFAAFVDGDGVLRATIRMAVADGYSGHALIGEHLVSWDTYASPIRVRRIVGETLVDVADPLEPGHVGRIAHVNVDDDGRLRVVSYQFTPDGTAVTFRLAELTVEDDGHLRARSAGLPSPAEIGSEPLASHVGTYGGFPLPVFGGPIGSGEGIDFVVPTGDGRFDIEGHPWIEVHTRIEGELGVDEVLAWSAERTLRWEEGPLSVLAVALDHGLAFTGRFLRQSDDSYAATYLAEALPSAPGAPPRVLSVSADPRRLGPVASIRRGARLGLATGDAFRVYALPGLEVLGASALTGSLYEVPVVVAWSGDDRVVEVSMDYGSGGLDATLRCHVLR